jgi:hypothetical protein
MRLALHVTLFLFAGAAASQSIQGTVTDKTSNELLPYVRIGVLHRTVGTISREDGKFTLDFPELRSTDTVVFSMLGYEAQKTSVASLQRNADVALKPTSYNLEEVTVSADAIVDLKKLGRFEPTKTTIGHSGTSAWGTGAEWGVEIKTDGDEFQLQKVAFHTRFNTLDSILFRINIYNLKDGQPDKSLLRQNVYVKSYKRNKWIVKDIKSENVVINSDIVVTMEIVRIWYNTSGEKELFFTYGKDVDRLKTFSRESSQSAWEINKMPPLAMYVLAQKLNEN